MVLSKKLLDILVCPETGSKLVLGDKELTEKANDLISRQKLLNLSGQLLTRPLSDLLIREDRATAYPVCDGIPVLLSQEAIKLSDID